jgi:hypothetical protein
LTTNFATVYPAGVEVGVAGSSGFSMRFTTASAITTYLPAGGAARALTRDLVNPSTSSSGVFGGQVLALQLNVDFSRAGLTPRGFGDLTLFATGTSLDGSTVSQILAAANRALGGGGLPSGYSFSTLNSLVTNLNEAYDNGNATAWATSHLR